MPLINTADITMDMPILKTIESDPSAFVIRRGLFAFTVEDALRPFPNPKYQKKIKFLINSPLLFPKKDPCPKCKGQ